MPCRIERKKWLTGAASGIISTIPVLNETRVLAAEPKATPRRLPRLWASLRSALATQASSLIMGDNESQWR